MPASSQNSGRFPTSCQPCRIRKVRCSRDGVPCQACVKWQFKAGECIYINQPRVITGESSADSEVRSRLLARIHELEARLQMQGGLEIQTTATEHSPSDSPVDSKSTERNIPALGDRLMNFEGVMSRTLSQTGAVHTSVSGHAYYISYALHWQSVVEYSPAADVLQSIDPEPPGYDDLQIPFTPTGNIPYSELFDLLPPRTACNTLKEVYFCAFSPIFHILHDRSFETEYQRFHHQATSVSTDWLALLFAIFTVAVNALRDDDLLLSELGHERHVGQNIKALFIRYQSAAFRCLSADRIMVRHSITSLQALILLTYARMQRGLSSWALLGLIRHAATSMGCHVDPDKISMHGPIECEERRRAWLGLRILFMVQSSLFGHTGQGPLPLDVKVPVETDLIELASCPVAAYSSAQPTKMSGLFLMHTVCEIYDKVNKVALHNQQFQPDITLLEEEMRSTRDRCHQRYMLDSDQENLEEYHQVNLKILDSQVYQAILILFRPGFCRFLQGKVTQETRDARSKCLSAARASLATFQSLVEVPNFVKYTWYIAGLGSFYAFHAVIVLAVGLFHEDDVTEFWEMKKYLGQILEIFAALSDRSFFCGRAIPMVHRIMAIAIAQHQSAQWQSAQHASSQPSQTDHQMQISVSLPPGIPSDQTQTFGSPNLWISDQLMSPDYNHLKQYSCLDPTVALWALPGPQEGQSSFEP